MKSIHTLTCVILAACMQYTSKIHALILQVKYKSSKIYVKKESNATLKCMHNVQKIKFIKLDVARLSNTFLEDIKQATVKLL